MKALIDTSILVDFLRGVREAKVTVDKVRNGELDAYVSALTEAELLAGRECEKESRREEIVALIALFTKLAVDNKISQKAGEFKRKYGVPLDDCIIAATAFVLDTSVWTKDVKGFEIIKEIKREEPY